MKRVVAAVGSGVRERLQQTVLMRSDVETVWSPDFLSALQVLFRARCDLFVAHSVAESSLPNSLHDLSARYPTAGFPILVLADTQPHEAYPPAVKALLPIQFETGAFNDTAARLLRLPTRQSARLPVRIGLCLGHHAGTQIANTVNISATGMLVEAFRPLIVGKVVEFKFLCRGNGQEQPVLKARVLRPEGPLHPGLSTTLYALEFVNVPADVMEFFLRSVLAV